MLFERLKATTSPYHQRLEGEPLSRSLLAPTATLNDYVYILQTNLGFYAPLEDRLGKACDWAALDFNYEQRRKTPLIEQDLRVLGGGDTALLYAPECNRLPPIGSVAAALGALYVLEGATLGGQLIARHIAMRRKLHPQNGCAFYNSYGDQVGRSGRRLELLCRSK
ncbi:biliverdin-producing heme oxygenase [Candidatus Gracilibacteria bacterium]|nr:biliverdin-producing heme oxygenase [Candidatus Gracilibacteria bacterium]